MPKQTVQSNINLESLAGGAFAEKLNEALMRFPVWVLACVRYIGTERQAQEAAVSRFPRCYFYIHASTSPGGSQFQRPCCPLAGIGSGNMVMFLSSHA